LLNEEAVRILVRALAGPAAALCFGLGDVHEHVPNGLAEACRRARLPLLTLPYGVPFLAVADVVENLRGQASQADSLGRLIDLVVSGMARPESLHDALATRGLDPNHLVVASWPSGSAALLSRKLDGGVVAETGQHTVTISASLSPVLAVARSTGLCCGYAHPAALAELVFAVVTAHLALQAAPTGGDAYGPDRVASFSLLLESIPGEGLRPFMIRVIEPLIAAGGHASPTYLDTLRAFIDHNLSVGQTAKAQFLHPNTVRHRLALIKEVTGKDPFVTEDVLSLAVAVRAHERDQRRLPTN
jgi:hypothetical protein